MPGQRTQPTINHRDVSSGARANMRSDFLASLVTALFGAELKLGLRQPQQPRKTRAMPTVTKPSIDLAAWLHRQTLAVDKALHRFLPKESAKPATIHRAMRYSIFAGGKRMRPALVLAASEACGGRPAD